MDAYVAANESSDAPWFEAGLRFKCTGCGKCCTGSSGSVYLSNEDIDRLAGFFKLPRGTFIRRYTRSNKGLRVLTDRPDSTDCVFLTGRACSVYEARPTQCRTYPWWIGNIQDRQSWEEAAQVCEGINHPDAPIISASEILEQCRIDQDNEATLERKAH